MARRKVSNPLDNPAAELPNDELGSDSPRQARIAQDYVRAVNPENGLEVVFKLDELLPEWAKEGDS